MEYIKNLCIKYGIEVIPTCLIDEQKSTKALSCKIPVLLEIGKDSLAHVSKMVENLGCNSVVRISKNKDGYLITDDGSNLSYVACILFSFLYQIVQRSQAINT